MSIVLKWHDKFKMMIMIINNWNASCRAHSWGCNPIKEDNKTGRDGLCLRYIVVYLNDNLLS